MSRSRTIAVVTGSRAEYGILRPVLRAIEADEFLSLRLLVCGAHLSHTFGYTVDKIEEDGIPVAERIETLVEGDTTETAAQSVAEGISGFARSFAKQRPDILLLTGDRPEMLAAGAAALLFGIAVAHLHGGELTFGAVDDSIRHALTKMSHIHFVATDAYAKRVIQMGEDPANVLVSGAPGLDNIRDIPQIFDDELTASVRMPLVPPPVLCTFHPITLEPASTLDQLDELLCALRDIGRPVVLTYPNADPLGQRVIAQIEAFAKEASSRSVVPDLGTAAYFSLMRRAAVMVGNSSSGIIEAASFQLPVVNIGSRQAGRIRAANVIDVAPTREAIRNGLETALTPGFRKTLSDLKNPYGDGRAAERIVLKLRQVKLGSALTAKRFRDFDLAS